jgi:Isoleucyl-tRNA synthetase
MSKSLGNVIAPEEILKKYGADILRVWVAASNYAEDLRIDYSILEQHAEAYRKIRNTFRYILGNLNDKFTEQNFIKIEVNELPELEQYMLHKISVLNENFHKNFGNYTFHNLYKELLNFCTVDLSAFYFDIRKDTLYCDDINSKKRKSCIILLNVLLECLLKWFAPILSFTTEEIYSLVSQNKNDSIHLKCFVKTPANWKNIDIGDKWEKVKKIRDAANISIESKRTEKIIGSSLEANIKIKLKQDLFELSKKFDLAEICITSGAQIELNNAQEDEIKVKTSKAKGKKCKICGK